MRNFEIALAAAACLVAASSAAGQGRTVVSATIVDPGTLPYAGASLTATLTTPVGTAGAYLNGVQIAGTVGPVQLDGTGSFLLNLADNTLVRCATPAGTIVACVPQTQWAFAVTLSPGVGPPFGFGPQTCSATVTITGAAQNISSSFTCPALVHTSTGLGIFVYNPLDTSGLACFVGSCATFGAGTSTSLPPINNAIFTDSPDGLGFAELEGLSDSAANGIREAAQVIADGTYDLSPVAQGYGALEHIGTATGSVNCLQRVGNVPCALGALMDVGDDVVSRNPVANVQDAVGVMTTISMNRTTPAHLGNAAGFVMSSPANTAGCGIGGFPCGTPAENAVNLYGFEVLDMEGRGTTSAIGFHVEPQTNPGATTGNFAIKVEPNGGPSSFDGTATSVNCQLGGAAGTTSPAACTSATAGMVAVPVSQTSYTVNTTKVTANSEIFVQQMTDNSGLPSAPACNAGTTNPIQSARVAGTSFSITLTSVASVTCFKFWIVN